MEEEIGEDYYSSLPTAPPPRLPITTGNNQEQQHKSSLLSDGKPSLLTASIKGDLARGALHDEPSPPTTPTTASVPTNFAQYSLLNRNSLSQSSSSSSDLGSSPGNPAKSYSRTITSKSPSRAINIGSTGSATPLAYSTSSARILNQSSLAHESTLDLYESSSFSSSPLTSASVSASLSPSASYRTYLSGAAASGTGTSTTGGGGGSSSGSGSSVPSQLGSPTPPGSDLPNAPPELPAAAAAAASGRAESPNSQGEALVVVELDKEREMKEKMRLAGSRREPERGDGMKKVSETPKKDSGVKPKVAAPASPVPSAKNDRRKYKTMAIPTKGPVHDDRSTAGTPVASNFDFKTLLERPDFKPIKTTIDAFVKGFEKKTKGNVEEEVKNTRLLIKATENSLKHHPIWSKLPYSHTIVAKEEMQRYIYSRLYNM